MKKLCAILTSVLALVEGPFLFADSTDLGLIDLAPGETVSFTKVVSRHWYYASSGSSSYDCIYAQIKVPAGSPIICKILPNLAPETINSIGSAWSYTNAYNQVKFALYTAPTYTSTFKVYENTYTLQQAERIYVPATADYPYGRTYYAVIHHYRYSTASASQNTYYDISFTWPVAPAQPPSITAQESGTGIQVTWGISQLATSYRLYKYCNGAFVTKWDRTDNSFYDSDVSSGNTYQYYVDARNEYGTSEMLRSGVVTYGSGSSQPQPSSGTKYALCVGINNYSLSGASTLNGCVNDAVYFRSNLVTRGNWVSSNTQLLKDTSATKVAIRNAMASFASRAVPGDTFIYYQSSHGGQNSGKSVFLCCYNDYYEDTELAEDLSLFQSGVKVVVIVDACHSGGLFKSTAEVPPFDLAERVTAIINEIREDTITKSGIDSASKNISSQEIGWVTAAEYDETSKDGGCYDSYAWLTDWSKRWSYVGGVCGGAFAGAFTWGWWNGQADTTGVGDNDGHMDAYEGYKFAHSVLTSLALSTPQYLNASVLRSIELGTSGGLETPVSSAPQNDSFANATRISGTSGSATGSTVGATYETGEPLRNYMSAATNTIWWVWTAPSSGDVSFNTTNTTFDTVMGIYTGTSVSSLTTIKQDDDGGPNRTSVCSFSATSGTTYYIAVSGYGNSNQGTVRLNWMLDSVSSPIWTIENGVLTGVELNGCTDIAIPNTVTSIGSSVFFWCRNLVSVTIPNSVTSIGADAFSNCSSLTSVTIPNSITNIGNWAFYNCSKLSSIVLPNSVTSVGHHMFFGCGSLASVTLPDNINYIGDGMFQGCRKMTSITIPNHITSIRQHAFYGCGTLTSITIPEGVTKIGDSTFYNCSNIVTVTFNGNAPTVGSEAFSGIGPSCIVKVTQGSTGWGVDIPGTWNGLHIEYSSSGANPYNVTYSLNSGTAGTSAPTNATYGTAFRVSAPSKTGYTFAGWTVTSGLNTNTAKYGTSSSSQTTSITNSTQKCLNGATGDVWFLNLTSTANGSVTLMANWTAKTYSVTLDPQGGSGGTASVTATYGSPMPSIVSPTRVGYVFGGYYTSTGGSGVQFYNAAGVSARSWNIASVTTLYAHWIATVPLATALDNSSLTFTTGGSANWVGIANQFYYGDSSGMSGAITHSQSTWLQTEVTGEGTLSFWYKVSSESVYDKLTFYIDGTNRLTTSGTSISAWQQFECVVSNNTQHIFKWTYSKDGSVSTGSDCCWIDKVEWTPMTYVDSGNVDLGFYALRSGWNRRGLILVPEKEDGDSWYAETPTFRFAPDDAKFIRPCIANFGDATISNVPISFICLDDGGETVASMYGTIGDNGIGSGYYSSGYVYRIGAMDSLDPGNYMLVADIDPDDTLGDTNILDNIAMFPFVVLPETEIPLADALGCSNLVFSTAGDNNAPFGQSFDGAPCVQFGPQWHSSTNSMLAEIEGPGTLSFSWKSSCEEGYDGMIFTVDGEVVGSITGASDDWEIVEIPLGEDWHSVVWAYIKDSADDDGMDAVFVADVEWSPEPHGGLDLPPDWVDMVETGEPLSWSSETSEPGWSIVDDGAAADGHVLRSDDVAAGGTATVSATVEGPGTLSFDWRISANRGDYARLYVDDIQKAQVTRNTAWATASVVIEGDGPHTVRWTYEHRASASANDNAAYLDNVAWHPITLADALDGEVLVWTTDDGAEWTAQLTVASDGEDAAVSGPVDADGISGLETTVIGPGTLAWRWKLAVADVAGLDVIVDGDFGDPARTYEESGDWAEDSLTFDDDGTHTIRFEFWNLGTAESDCAYLDCVSWTPAGAVPTEVVVENVSIPTDWLSINAAPILAEHDGDYEAAANADAANGVNKVWECYVAGISPTNDTQVFRAIISWENGKPKISWEPKLAPDEEAMRVYTEIGKTNLTDKGWTEVSPANRDGMKFFKVKVEMK